MGTKRKRLLSLLGIYAAVVVLSLLLYGAGLLDSWQEKITDRFYTRHEPQQNIVIIAIDDESLNKIGQWPWPRSTFAKALDNISGAAAVGVDVSFSEPSRTGPVDDALLATSLQRISSKTVVLPVQLAPRGKVAALPLPLFTEQAKVGFVNLPVDSDGIVRRTLRLQGDYQSFSSLLAETSSPSDVSTAPSEFRIRYSGPQKSFLTIPFIDLLEGRVPQEVLDGSIVLVGATASDLHDTVNTPFGPMPGVEAHANEIETLLGGTFLHPMPPLVAVPLMLLADLLALWAVTRLRRLSVLLPALAAPLILLNLLALALFSYQIIVPVLYLDLSYIATCALGIAFEFASESREKRFIRKTFQYYLMPEVVQELIEHPEKLALGGERKKMTILFSDIRGFTSISERLSPTELTSVMNDYLTAMTDVIMENKGLVDKYIGDAIMAFWGAPLENQTQAEDACRAAISMSEKLIELNARWKEADLPELNIGIGISSGPVVVGNMGSLKRFNYTVMGDEVNFASRLEGLTKAYGTACIVSESTRTAADSSDLHFREIDTVRVKGKQTPRKIFQLITKTGIASTQEQLHHFEAGREAYTKGNWSAATLHFEKSLKLGEDGPSRELLTRSLEFRQNPPQDWTGVYEFRNK